MCASHACPEADLEGSTVPLVFKKFILRDLL